MSLRYLKGKSGFLAGSFIKHLDRCVDLAN